MRPRLFDCLLCIVECTRRLRMPPTIVEVSREMGLTGAHAWPHIRELEKMGMVTRRGPRSMQLTGAGQQLLTGAKHQKKEDRKP